MLVSGVVKTKNAEPDSDAVRNSELNGAAVQSSEGDGNDTKPETKTTSPIVDSETPSSVTADLADHQSFENGLEPADRDMAVTTSDAHLEPPECGSKDARKTNSDKSEGCNMSCIRDVINSAIEKTLQDSGDQRRSQTPPPSKFLAFTCSLLTSVCAVRVIL